LFFACGLGRTLGGAWFAHSVAPDYRSKKSFSATEQDRPEVEARRQAFWDRAVAIPLRSLIFIDESGCTTAMTPRYAPAPIGQRATASRPVNRGKNVSIIGAIRLTGVVAVRAYDGAINAAKFLHWLRHNFCPTRDQVTSSSWTI
jgi:DDE superfamily endonuclease